MNPAPNVLRHYPLWACFCFLLALPAAAQVIVQECPLPTRHFAHEVWADAASDRPVWIAFQKSGHLGQLNPKIGKVDPMPLESGWTPHGVIAEPDGAPWLTDGGQNTLVRVDPRTNVPSNLAIRELKIDWLSISF